MEVVGTPIPGFKLFKQLAVSGSLALPPGWKRIPAGFPRGTLQGVVLAKKQPSPRGPGIRARAGSGTGGGSGPELFKVADIHMMRVYVQVPQQFPPASKRGSLPSCTCRNIPTRPSRGPSPPPLARSIRTRGRYWSSSMLTIRMGNCSPVPMPRSISSCRATPTSSAFRPARSFSASKGWRSNNRRKRYDRASADQAWTQSRNRSRGGARLEALGPAGQQPAGFARNGRQGSRRRRAARKRRS